MYSAQFPYPSNFAACLRNRTISTRRGAFPSVLPSYPSTAALRVAGRWAYLLGGRVARTAEVGLVRGLFGVRGARKEPGDEGGRGREEA